MCNLDVDVLAPTMAPEELLRNFFRVIEDEARTNVRFKHALIVVLCNVAVAVPSNDPEFADLGKVLGSMPW